MGVQLLSMMSSWKVEADAHPDLLVAYHASFDKDPRIDGLDRGGIEAPRTPEPMPPTLRFSLSTGVGKLELAE